MPPKPSRPSGLRKPASNNAVSVPDTDTPSGKRGKSNWPDDHVEILLELVRQYQPKGSVQWNTVSEAYNRKFRNKSEACFQRTTKAISEKWRSLMDSPLPTGCGELSMMNESAIKQYGRKQQLIIRAKQINLEIATGASIENYQSGDDVEHPDTGEDQLQADELPADSDEDDPQDFFDSLPPESNSAAAGTVPDQLQEPAVPSQATVFQSQPPPSDSNSMPPPPPKTPVPRRLSLPKSTPSTRDRRSSATSTSSDESETNRKRFRADSALESIASSLQREQNADNSTQNSMLGLLTFMFRESQESRREEREARKEEREARRHELMLFASLLGRPVPSVPLSFAQPERSIQFSQPETDSYGFRAPGSNPDAC